MKFIDLLGYVAAVGTTGAFVPQVYKVYKTKKTEDLSLSTFLLFCIGIVLWTIYGFYIQSLPVILANSITFALAFYILLMKIRYK
jgi:MtN3 and saliva related transmembrane protein